MQEFLRYDLHGASEHLQVMLDKLAEDYRNDLEEAIFVIEKSPFIKDLWDANKQEFGKNSREYIVLCSADSGNYHGSLDEDRINRYVEHICGSDVEIFVEYSDLSVGDTSMSLTKNGKKVTVSTYDFESYVGDMELLEEEPWIPANEEWINSIKGLKREIKQVVEEYFSDEDRRCDEPDADCVRQALYEAFDIDSYGDVILRRALKLGKEPFET